MRNEEERELVGLKGKKWEDRELVLCLFML